MTERVDVANQALSWLGAASITSLEDDSTEARQMKINYVPSRDATLEAYTWSFAMKRFIPAKLAEAPVYGPAFAFAIPSDILRVTRVDYRDLNWGWENDRWSSRSFGQDQAEWTVESGVILSDRDPLFCQGIRRITDEGIYSPLFVHAFAAKLATLTAITLTQSATIQREMAGIYAGFIREAASRDGQQGRNRRIRNQSLNVARVSGRSW